MLHPCRSETSGFLGDLVEGAVFFPVTVTEYGLKGVSTVADWGADLVGGAKTIVKGAVSGGGAKGGGKAANAWQTLSGAALTQACLGGPGSELLQYAPLGTCDFLTGGAGGGSAPEPKTPGLTPYLILGGAALAALFLARRRS